jgi:hypothetical protein
MTIFWSACAWLAFAAVALATDVTTCYQTIAARDIAVLQTDLDCSMVPGSGPDVVLERGARLQLNGHRLLGGRIGVGSNPGGRRVIVDGPGEISGMTGCGISAQGAALVRNVQVHDNGCGITAIYTFRLALEDTSVTNNVGDGVTYLSDVKHAKVSAERVTISGNGGAGMRAPRTLSLEESSITGNSGGGAIAGHTIRAKNSTLTGNGSDGDVATRRAILQNTTCEHSVDLDTSLPLGVCSLD